MFDDFQDMEEGQDAEGFSSSYEPDDPEGLKPARDSSLCLGHEQTEKALLDLINAGSMPHALIFSGPEGIGKSTFAFRLARYLLKNGTADSAQDSLFGDMPAEANSLDIASDDPIFSRVASGGHPDLLTLERPIDARKGTKKNNLDVETARKVTPFLRMTASDGGWRVVIVDDADTMNRNAQNALLKILEEPPSNALLILITHRLGAMIPTIRSRCRVMNMAPLEPDVLSQLMHKEIGNTLGTTETDILSSIAEGSIGAAQQIIESGGLETIRTVLSLLEFWPQLNWVNIHHLADQNGRAGKEEAFTNIEKTFLWVANTIIFTKARGQASLPNALNSDAFNKMMAQMPLPQWLEISEKLKAHFLQARHSNLDKRQAILEAFQIITPAH